MLNLEMLTCKLNAIENVFLNAQLTQEFIPLRTSLCNSHIAIGVY